jgi:hypothetical protein
MPETMAGAELKALQDTQAGVASGGAVGGRMSTTGCLADQAQRERATTLAGPARYNAAVQQTYIRLWFKTLRVCKELARGHFCSVTPP